MNINRGDQEKKKRTIGQLLAGIMEGIFRPRTEGPSRRMRKYRRKVLEQRAYEWRRARRRMQHRSRQINYARARR